jgi:hypothetical protein
LKNREGDPKPGAAKRFDLLRCAGLLAAKLVAWKSKDFQSLTVKFIIEILKLFVLRSKAALASYIDY